MPSYIRTRSEFAVNSFTALSQTAPTVATFGDGGFVIAWGTSDPAQDGSESAIKAQLFDSAGRKVGSEFLVNSTAAGYQFTPEVQTLADGSFVVAWTSMAPDGTYSIRAQIHDRDGDPIGGEFQVNPNGWSYLSTPTIAALTGGGFVVSWDDSGSSDVKAQIFDSAGSRVGAVFTLNTKTLYSQEYGDMTALAGGGFVATWRTSDSTADGSSYALKAQVFSATGAKLGSEFLVNTLGASYQYSPSITALSGGGFVVAWQTGDTSQDGSSSAIKAQIFSASGAKVGTEFLVNTQAADTQQTPVVTAVPGGGFMIAWTTFHSAQDGSSFAVKAQMFDSAGAKVGGEMLVNTLASGSQSMPDLATLADGRVIATWASESGDQGGLSIRAQILGTELAAPLANTAPTIISNGGAGLVSLTQDEMVTSVTTIVASDDGEPNNLRYSIAGGADGALFTINALTGALSFRQSPDHEAPLDQGSDNFYDVTVAASDGQLTGLQSFQIYVRHLNQVHIVSDGGWDWAEIYVGENQTAVTTVAAMDNDGLALTYSITGGEDSAFFTIDSQTGELSFAVAPDYEWPEDYYQDNIYFVTVTATDGTVSDSQEIAVFIEDVSEPDGFAIVSDGAGDQAEILAPENETLITTVTAQNAAGPVTYEIVGGMDASWLTIDPMTGELSFLAAPDFEEGETYSGYYGYPYSYGHDNSYEVIVRASDGQSVDEQYLTILVQDVDEAPIFYSEYGYPYQPGEVVGLPAMENALGVGAFFAHDPDPYSYVSYGIAGGADSALFEIDPYSGTLSFVGSARPDYEAPADADGDNVYEVAIIAYSGALSTTQAFQIYVQDEDEGGPIAFVSGGGGDQAAVTVDENMGNVFGLLVTGGDGTTPQYGIAGGADAALFELDPVTRMLRFKTQPDFEAPGDADGDNVYEVIVEASDGQSSDYQSVSVTVANVYEGLGFAAPASALAVAEGSLEIGSVSAEGEAGASIVYAIAGGADAALFSVDSVTGELSWVEAPDFEAPGDSDGDNVYDLIVEASDGTSSASQSVSVTVGDVGERPSFAPDGDSILVAEGETAVTIVAASDPEGNAVSFAIAGGADAALFAIDAATGALSFLAAPDFEAPADSDGDNVYDVEVSASDGQLSETKAFSIVVADTSPPVAVGGEFVVNSTYSRSQVHADATRLADGNFLVTWVDADFNTTAGRFLRAQIFAPDGVKIGGELTLASGNNVGTQPAVAALADGGFVVTSRPMGSIVVQTFDSAGVPTGAPVTVSNAVSSSLGEPQIAVLANGGFAITWDDNRSTGTDTSGSGVHLRVYDSAGAPVGGDVLVNTSTAGNQADPSISALAGGGYVVTWTDRPGQGAPWVAKAQIFDSAGARVGGEFVLSGPPTLYGGVVETSVVSLSNGNFAVAWSEGTESGPALRIQIFTPDGVKVGEPIVAPSHAYGLQVGPSITALSDGGFAVAWSPDNPPYSDGSARGIFVQAYDNAGQPQGAPLQVNGQANGDQFDPSLAGLSDGRFVVTWTDLNGAGADDDQVMARIFAPEGYVPNQRPVIDSDGGGASASIQVDEGQTAVTDVAASDPDGPQPVTYSIAGGAHAALFEIDPSTGALGFIAAPDHEAPAAGTGNVYSVIVRAGDGELSSFQSIEVVVRNVNEGVAITSGGGTEAFAVAVAENGAAVTGVAASDVDGDPVAYSIAGGADSSLFAIDAQTGALSFVQGPDFEAPGDVDGDNVHEVIVGATDGVHFDYQTVSVTVANAYEGVSFDPADPFTVDEGSVHAGAVSASGEADASIVYAIAGGADAAKFTIDPGTGAIAFVTAPDFESAEDSGSDNVYDLIVSASDGISTDSRSVSVAVGNIDEPVEILSYGGASAVALIVEENHLSVGAVAARDEEDWPVTFSITGGADAGLFQVDAYTGALSFAYQNMPDFEAPGDSGGDNVYDVVVTASSSTSTADQAFAISVADRNESLWITSNGGGDAVVSINEGESAVTAVAAFDQDGDAPVYSIVGGADAALFAIDSATGALTFIAAPDHEAPQGAAGVNSYSVEVGASDGEFTDTQKIRIDVANVNEGVSIVGAGGTRGVSVAENGTAVTVVAASDVDGDSLTWSIAGGADAALFAIDASTGALSFVQAPNFEASADSGGDNVYDVVVSVTDGAFTDSQAIAVSVGNVDEGVAITSNGGGSGAAVSVAENGTAVAVVAAVDIDGGPVSYAIAGGADSSRFAIDASTGALSFVQAPNFEASADSGGDNVYDVVVSATDGTFTDTQAIAVSVGNVDEGVAITSNGGGAVASVAAAENGTAVAVVAAVDIDGGPVSYAIAGGADSSRFTIDSATGLLAFVAAPDFEAPGDSDGDNVYDVIVSASDGTFVDTQALAVGVADVNEAPVVTSGATFSMAENGLAAGTVASTDPDGSAADYSIVGGADSVRFTIDAQTGELQFVDAPDWELPADFGGDNVYDLVVRSSDGQLFDDHAMSVTVTNVRDGNNVTGANGGDSISATSTSFALRTSSEEDLVYGRGGHDTIHGMAGDDELHGEGGNDVLIGGDGSDLLSGGFGKDRFTYNDVSESTAAASDLIADFSRSQGDKISLSGIDANSLMGSNQGFTFIGTSAFSNIPAQLRFETAPGMTIISGDVDGDGIADLQIQLSGQIPLIASDFIL